VAGPGWYHIDSAEEQEVLAALRERHLSRYRFDDPDALSRTMVFERELGALLGARHALALNSCTSALLAGLTALGVGPGDEVIVPGYTFIASIASVLLTGARPVLAEIDESLTLDPADVTRKLTPRTKAIMAVHMLGAPADLDRLTAIASGAGCSLIEDCAQACGGSYRGRRLGTVGSFGAFSFNVGKTITTGDGGLLTTDSETLYQHAFAFHDHGFAPHRAGVAQQGPRIGLNLRLHELAAAMGTAQVRKLDGILSRCRQLKAAFAGELRDLPGVHERTVHDEAGECATTHVLVFDDPATATDVAKALHGHTLAGSPKHNYALMGQLHGEFARVANAVPGDLPRTDDILSRCVALSIGVVDPYLGTLGDVTVLDTPEEVVKKARHLRQSMEPFLAGTGEHR
jgi:dTDP-4-amino-4,6-dideoxygalactose transaminase